MGAQPCHEPLADCCRCKDVEQKTPSEPNLFGVHAVNDDLDSGLVTSIVGDAKPKKKKNQNAGSKSAVSAVRTPDDSTVIREVAPTNGHIHDVANSPVVIEEETGATMNASQPQYDNTTEKNDEQTRLVVPQAAVAKHIKKRRCLCCVGYVPVDDSGNEIQREKPKAAGKRQKRWKTGK
uniref:Uncharacterized protein n=1 Tax=Karlodinium veneficum TaxID=407301 RepID=A7WQ11_KARVE|nr:unknown [Karlodinium veneficum]